MDEYSAFTTCLFCSVFIWPLFMYYIYYKHKLWRIFTLLETLPFPHNPFFKLLFINYLSFFVRDYINHKVFEKVEPYLKLLDPLLCVNLLVTCVLQYLFKTVLCWMQFKAKAVKWPVREFIQLFTEGQ